jgi:diguanylate cyclase (GGDEF)-like protein
VLLQFNFAAFAAQVTWEKPMELVIDQHMEFTVSDRATLTGTETWSTNGAQLPRKTEQYLHFRLNVINPKNLDQTLWLEISFPAIKHLTLSDGLNTWITGDAKPFSTRPVNSPNYIFPVVLRSEQSTKISGSMQGEILRYSFSLSTPEIVNAAVRHDLIRDMSFFGSMGTLVIVCLIIYFATRHQSYLSFAVFAFSFGAWFFRVLGYGFEILWPNAPQFNDVSYALLLYCVMVSSSWMVVSLLKRHNRTVKYQKVLFGYTTLLVVSGLCSALFLDLNTTLRIPLYWFFPAILMLMFVIYQEHKAGSIKAKWFALSMLPLIIGTSIVVIFGLGFNLAIDPVMAIMLGIVTTCLLLTVLISTYLIKLLQSQRDTKQQQAVTLDSLVQERTQALELSNQQLIELAAKDPLTKLPNRRSLDIFVDDNKSQGSGRLGIAMVDLDHFKRVNDTYGHDVGDLALCEVANLLKPLNTSECIAGRYGGEEFAIVLRESKDTEFEALLLNLHQKINSIVVANYPDIQVKTCIGWAISSADEPISECFRRADKALYQAKEQGRNRVIRAND